MDTLLKFYFPYCLDLQPDGRYAVLNRRYKPVGMTVGADVHVHYTAHPVLIRFARLTRVQARLLSVRADESLQRIYLYDDSSRPTASAAAWSAYCERLQRLARLRVQP